MKAVVLLCLLHAAFIETKFNWPESGDTARDELEDKYGCEANLASCGCCVMKRQMERSASFFDFMIDELYHELHLCTETTLSNVTKEKYSVFSVALHDLSLFFCVGPFDADQIIIFNHILVNTEYGYSEFDGIFTVPYSGVYSLSVTIYGYHATGSTTTCADLQVNGQVVASLPRKSGQDDQQDSSTEVIVTKLMTGDQVAVTLPAGCIVCDDNSHMTVFTGYLLYATE